MDVLWYIGVLLLVVVVSFIYYLTRPRRECSSDLLKMWPIGVQPPSVSVPGLPKTDPDSGNTPDMVKSGGMQGFLKQLHSKYGDIASFWWGRHHSVAICSPELFEKVAHLFDKSAKAIEPFETLLTKHNLSFINLKEGWNRRKLYEKALIHGPRKNYYNTLQEVVDEVVTRMAALPPEQHVDIHQYVFEFAFTANAVSFYGIPFGNPEELNNLRASIVEVSIEMEAMTFLGRPEEGSERMKIFQKVRETLYGFVERAIQHRRDNPPAEDDDELFIDVLMKSGLPEEDIFSETASFFYGGIKDLLTFCFYYLGSNPDIQERLHDELIKVLGNKNVSPENVNDLIYTRQVIDESLRCATVVGFNSRYSTEDIKLGGYTIPAMTPIITSIATSLLDGKHWSNPNRFDPDRFSPENRCKIPYYGFIPFGLGGRKCPVYHFVYAQSTIAIATLVRKFIFKLTPGDVSENTYSIISRPEGTIWLTIEQRG